MREFWNQRYSEKDFVYGENPNDFLKKFIDSNEPGKILFPAEGEGRNVVYASTKGWQCEAFDYSETAKLKEKILAEKYGVDIFYEIHSYENFKPKVDYFDVVAMIFAHLHKDIRIDFFDKLKSSIKNGGLFIAQVFSKEQLNKQLCEISGGPKDIDMLYSISEFKELFSGYEILQLEDKEIILNEGSYHNGTAHVVEAILRKR